MVEQTSDVKLQGTLHDRDNSAGSIGVHEAQEPAPVVDEDRPRSLGHTARQEEALMISKGANAIKIINLLSSTMGSSTGIPSAADEVDETTSSLASFDISHEGDGAGEEDERSKQTAKSPALTLVVDSSAELAAAAIIDPIEGRDEEFDVDLSSPPLTEDELSTSSTADSHLDTLIAIEGQHGEACTADASASRHGHSNDYEHLDHHAAHHGHHHGGKTGGIYGKVVKSIQKSIRKIFQPKEHHHQHHGEAAVALYAPSSDVPSVAISPLSTYSSSPITSATSQAHAAMLPLTDGSLHKTLVIDVSYTKPLLDLPSPMDSGKKCLVLDLDETLVHSTFQPVPNADLIVPVHLGEGLFQPIYVCKRPGVDEFLRQATELFEVIIFTASLSNYADPVIDFLDPAGGIKFRLYREDCLQFQGMYIKDLSRLGRDLDQVLIIDNSPASYSMQPANALGCRSWFKDPHDRELEERILPMLHKLHAASSVTHWRGENLVNIETPY